jgi:hypothetical protein
MGIGCDFGFPVQRSDNGWALLPPPLEELVADDLVQLAAGLNRPGEVVYTDNRESASMR